MEDKEIQKYLQDRSNDENRNKAWILRHKFVQRRLNELCEKGTSGRIAVEPKLKMNLRAGLLAIKWHFRDSVQLRQIKIWDTLDILGCAKLHLPHFLIRTYCLLDFHTCSVILMPLCPGITLFHKLSFLNKWNKWSSSMEKLMSMPRSLYPQLSSSLLSCSRTFFLT